MVNSSPHRQIFSLGRLPSNFTLNPIYISLNGVLWFHLATKLGGITFHPRWPCAQLKNRMLSLGKIHSVRATRVNQYSRTGYDRATLPFLYNSPALSLPLLPSPFPSTFPLPLLHSFSFPLSALLPSPFLSLCFL